MNTADPNTSPFPGLRPYELADAPLFFGRHTHVAQMISLLERQRFLAVVGASGSGKSSLVRAGLLSAIRNGYLLVDGEDENDAWQQFVMRPGDDPYRALATSLCSVKTPDQAFVPEDRDIEATDSVLRSSQFGLTYALRRLGVSVDQPVVLVVDQFEELFRFRRDEATRRRAGITDSSIQSERRNEINAFVNLLLRSTEQSEQRVCIILTMRSDFLGDCDAFIGLPEAISRSQYLTPRLTRSQLEEAIRRPLGLPEFAADIEEELVTRILNDVGAEPDQLPLMQHALMRTWQNAQAEGSRVLQRSHYDQARGVEGALEKHAEDIFDGLGDDRTRSELQRIARSMFCSLSERRDGGLMVRRPSTVMECAEEACVGRASASGSELATLVTSVIEVATAFWAANLLTFSPDREPVTAETKLDISHESLQRQWTRLQNWLSAEAEAVTMLHRLEDAVRSQVRRLDDVTLEQAIDWQSNVKPTSAWARRYQRLAGSPTGEDLLSRALALIESSKKARDDEANEKTLRQQERLEDAQKLVEVSRQKAAVIRKWLMAVAVLAVAMVALAAVASIASIQAKRAQHDADVNERQAVANAKQAKEEAARADTMLERSEHLLYASQVRAAEQSYQSNDATRCRDLLDTCRWDYRGFDHSELYGRIRPWHSGPVNSVSFSPDGKLFVSGSSDNTIKVWDAATWSEVRTLTGHSYSVNSVSFSPDGKQLVSGSVDAIRVWDAATWSGVCKLTGHSGDGGSLSFSPDGKQFVSGSYYNTIKVWDASTWSEVRTDMKHSDSVNSVSFSPDGKQLVSGTVDGEIKVWDAATWSEVRKLTVHSGYVWSVRFSPDGKQLVSRSSDHTIKVWDAATGSEVRTLTGHSGSVNSVCFSPNGKQLVSGSVDKMIKVWDAATGSEVRTLTGHSGPVNSVSFSPDGNKLVSGSSDNTIKVWDTATWSEVRTLTGHSGPVYSVSFSPDGKQLVSGSYDHMIKVWDVATWSKVRTLTGHSDSVRSVSFSPDGKQLVSGSSDSTIKVWDAATRSEVRTLTGHSGDVFSVSFSPDGTQLASGLYDNTIKVWDAATWSKVRKLTGHSGPVFSVSFSPDGTQLASGSSDKTIKVWDAATESKVRTLTGHSGPVYSVIFSPDGKQLVSGSEDNTIKVWDAATESEVRTLTGHSSDVWSVSFSPDGKQLASRSSDNMIKVWDAATGSEVRTLTGHTGSVNSVRFSPDGKQLVSGTDDGEIKVWGGSHRRAMLPIFAGSEPINTASISHDETLIVSGNAKGLVQVWDALSGQAITNLPGHEYSVQAVAISPVMKRIVEQDDEPELTSPERLHRIQQVASGSSDKTVRLWDLELRNRRVLKTTETKLEFDSEQGVHRIAFSENGRWIAAGGSSGLVRIWDTSTHELLDSFDAHAGFVKSLEFTDRDATLVTSGWAAERGPTEFRTWRIKDGKRFGSSGSGLIPALPGNWHSGMATHGNRVATGRSDGILFVSDLGSETKPLLILAHPGRKEKNDQGVEVVKESDIQAVAFSPDGELLATAGTDHSIQLWNPRTGERLAVLSEHTAAVNSLQFYRHKSRGICAPCDPDELRLLSSGSDGTVRVWLIAEILAHPPLPIPGERVPFSQIANDGSAAAETAPHVIDIASLEPSIPDVPVETAGAAKPKSATQPSPHRELAFALIILAALSLLLTFNSHRRRKLQSPNLAAEQESLDASP